MRHIRSVMIGFTGVSLSTATAAGQGSVTVAGLVYSYKCVDGKPAAGEPLAGVNVRLVTIESAAADSPWSDDTTNTQGLFNLLAPGAQNELSRVYVVVSDGRWCADPVEVSLPAGPVALRGRKAAPVLAGLLGGTTPIAACEAAYLLGAVHKTADLQLRAGLLNEDQAREDVKARCIEIFARGEQSDVWRSSVLAEAKPLIGEARETIRADANSVVRWRDQIIAKKESNDRIDLALRSGALERGGNDVAAEFVLSLPPEAMKEAWLPSDAASRLVSLLKAQLHGPGEYVLVYDDNDGAVIAPKSRLGSLRFNGTVGDYSAWLRDNPSPRALVLWTAVANDPKAPKDLKDKAGNQIKNFTLIQLPESIGEIQKDKGS